MIATQLTFFSPESAPVPLTPETEQPALPTGWRWVRLSDVVSLSSEKYQPKGESQYYVGLEHIEKNSGLIAEHAQIEPISTAKNSFRTGEILYGKLRPYLNKVALANRNGVCSTDILVLRTHEIAEPKFIHYFMLRDEFVNDMSANSMGVNLPRVPTKYILACPIPLPPLAEQQRIVARIEELLSEVDAGVTEIEAALKRLKTYRQAVLHHFLNNQEWERVKLGDIANLIRNGISAKPDQTTGLRILRISAVRPNILTLNDVRYLHKREEYEPYILDEGDLLFTRYNGSIDYTGVCAVFKPVDSLPTVHPDKLIRVKTNSDLCLPEFISYSANSGVGRAFVRQRIRTTAGQSGISGADVKAIPILLPDLVTQNRIVQEIEARLSQADALEATLRTELQRAGRLRQSVLKQAFLGKLIPSVPL